MQKTFAIISSVLLFLSSFAGWAQAETVRMKTLPNTNALSVVKQGASNSADTKTENLKERATNEIKRRISALNELISRIGQIDKLSDSQKSALTANIQAQIALLNALNTKIQADTDIDTLREDVKSIVLSYRIYLLYIPMTRIIIAGYSILNVTDIFNAIIPTLQAMIDVLKSAGLDTTSYESYLKDMQAKITDAQSQAHKAIDTVTPLQPTGYPGNKPDLQNARTMLKTAQKDLEAARADAQKLFKSLKAKMSITPANPSVTPDEITSTPTEIPSPTQ